MSPRVDLRLIASWIPAGSSVLDLGCGQGTLLKDLAVRKNCRIQGVEVDPESLLQATWNGVPVIQADIDVELGRFQDSTYDVVILSKTLQAVRHPATVLRHMLRIAPRGIISMPNFAYWRNRVKLAFGRAPVSKDLPYAWHDSPNVHFGSCLDLEALFSDLGLQIQRSVAMTPSGGILRAPYATRNWSAGATLYELTNPDNA